jgi:hypothetical protein
MFISMKTAARQVGTGLALVSLTALLALPAMAEADAKNGKPTSGASKARAVKPKAAANSIVVRDAETGQLRAATAEEAAALNRKPKDLSNARAASATGVASQTQAKSHSSGAVGVRLTDEFATYSVATKRADGSLAIEHVDGRQAANAAVKGAKVLPTPAQLPTK